MVVIDSTTLLLLFQPDAGVPNDSNGKPVSNPKERVAYLVDELQKAGVKIMIPTPVLSEILVRAGTAQSSEIVEELNRQAVFRIEPFDVRAAIEVAAMSRTSLDNAKGPKRATEATYAKIKYDRQIIAMAKVAQVTTIYSDDTGLRTTAERAGITVVGLADLTLPPELLQKELELFATRKGTDVLGPGSP